MERRLTLANFWIAVGAFGLGALMAVMQALSRADLEVPFRSPKIYYLSVTAHGVLMALVFTTFFIMALGYAFANSTLGGMMGRKWAQTWGWASFWIATIGTAITTVAILSGTSTVLYTFYPPMKAHPAFYIGATLLIIGSWIWGGVMLAAAWTWRKEHPGKPLPLAVHGILTTVIIWYLATSGLAAEVLGMLIPWSLGWVKTIDPVLARTYFWWFGHPLTYFWLVPAYIVWYTVLPRVAGGKLFSDPLARMVFILFILFSTPVGFHHQFADPGISASFKLLHTVTTYAILFPSLVTAFTVIASLEVAGRSNGRLGGRGLFSWIRFLPWKDPLVASVVLAMITFALGGFGGAINAAYAMNTMVHNTAWVMGHFHLTVGTAVALTFMGVSYWLLPRLTGRQLVWRPLAIAQPYLWFVGMMLFGVINHITGLQGMPRRVYSAAYLGAEGAAPWEGWTTLTALGGIVLFISSLFYLAVLIGTIAYGRKGEPEELEFAEPLDAPPERRGLFDRFLLWTGVAVILIIIAYGPALYHLISMERYGSLPFAPF
jgi:cytochrome c oxidase subunit 1